MFENIWLKLGLDGHISTDVDILVERARLFPTVSILANLEPTHIQSFALPEPKLKVSTYF
jgi:hypothetical protein